MIKYFFYTAIAALAVGFVLGWLVTDRTAKIVTVVQNDTLRVEVPQPPDTVIFEKVRTKWRTVYRDTGSTRTDTVYIDTLLAVARSEKRYRFPFVESRITAWAPAPVDSFDNEIIVDWRGYIERNVNPAIRQQLNSERRIGRWQGFAAAAIAFGGTLYLIK